MNTDSKTKHKIYLRIYKIEPWKFNFISNYAYYIKNANCVTNEFMS